MNRTAVAFLLVTIAAGACAKGAKGPYGIKSGLLETTTETFGTVVTTEYFDDHGARSAKYTTTTVMGQTSRKLEIRLPEGVGYTVDLDNGRGTRFRLAPGAAAPDAVVPPLFTKAAQVVALDPREVLGRKCDGKQWTAEGAELRVWSWKGLPLYTELGGGPKPMVVRATRVSEEPVPAERFAVPAGIRIEALDGGASAHE